MKILGYLLKGVSIFIFILLLMSLFNTLSQISEYQKEGFPFLFGYIVGIIILVALIGWIAFKLLKYSNRLLVEAKKSSLN
ncbi:hypothetical protein B0I03_101543 [Flavobacterium aquaticum]|uniref:DUF1049 domain-containing protein n=1 Tax=Flavobacterium aquaticum TaxID=1236486 RepID=A0A327Z4Q3_9FLAO|nr:hypothetical protein [Flavobacterium aquaticum]RAK25369.1 hypothetical protein B0I03_101543 [Flavobacterium aquaticum]